MTMRRLLFLLASICLGLLSACSLTPEYKRSEIDNLVSQPFVQNKDNQSQASVAMQVASKAWWKQLNDPLINDLVDQALDHNYEIKLALANLEEAEAVQRSNMGDRLPKIDLSLSGNRRHFGIAGPGFSGQRDLVTSYEAALAFSWQLDLFGRLRSAQNAAAADFQASAADRDAVLQTVIANVIRQRVALAIARQRLQVAEQITDSRQRTLATVERRYRRGVINSSAVGVRLARSDLYAALSRVTEFNLNVDLAQHALDILLGKPPQLVSTQHHQLNSLPILDAKIAGIPAQLLDRRPDLQASEFRTIASNERIGVAIANLFPDLVLTGRLSLNEGNLSRLFSLDNLIASVAGELATTLFQGGKLRAEVDAAKARLQAQASQYANTVLQAIREVEDALARNRQLAKRYTQIEQQVTESRIAESLSQQRYGRGIETLITVLEAERRRQEAEDLVLLVKQQRWDAYIDLQLALGGQWLDDTSLKLTQAAQ
jgi:NodT family efflux transporter outer membrane factor (OMF) lipoprotein